MYQNIVKSGLISGGHIRPGLDMKICPDFWVRPDMISGATLSTIKNLFRICNRACL